LEEESMKVNTKGGLKLVGQTPGRGYNPKNHRVYNIFVAGSRNHFVSGVTMELKNEQNSNYVDIT
jgi:hypothetical protein